MSYLHAGFFWGYNLSEATSQNESKVKKGKDPMNMMANNRLERR
jgi:hypothetical protein